MQTKIYKAGYKPMDDFAYSR